MTDDNELLQAAKASWQDGLGLQGEPQEQQSADDVAMTPFEIRESVQTDLSGGGADEAQRPSADSAYDNGPPASGGGLPNYLINPPPNSVLTTGGPGQPPSWTPIQPCN